MNELNWRKSSRSGQGGQNCVELAGLRRGVAVRDSKNPDGPKLAFGRDEWVTFTNAIKQRNYHLR